MAGETFFYGTGSMLPATNYLMDFLLSSIPAGAFALFFGVPLRYVPLAALGGAVAHLTRTVCTDAFGIGIVAATFIASSVISVMFILIAPRICVPRPVFTVASIVPIIPGKFAYLTLLSLIKLHNEAGDSLSLHIAEFFENGILTTFVLLAIGMGIAMPSLFFYRSRPVV
ncbi:MAG: threonine/serine exporter family protein [Succinivibrionaceae bacterium]